VFTISFDNTNSLSIHSNNTGLPTSAQISTSLEIVCVAIKRWLVLSQQTASSSSELRGEGPLVHLALPIWRWSVLPKELRRFRQDIGLTVLGSGSHGEADKRLCGTRLREKQATVRRFQVSKGKSIALYPLKTA